MMDLINGDVYVYLYEWENVVSDKVDPNELIRILNKSLNKPKGWFLDIDLKNTPVSHISELSTAIVNMTEESLTFDKVQEFCHKWKQWEARQRNLKGNNIGIFVFKLKEYCQTQQSDVLVVKQAKGVKLYKDWVDTPPVGVSFTDEQKAEFNTWFEWASNEEKEAYFEFNLKMFKDHQDPLYRLCVQGIKLCKDMKVDWLGNKLEDEVPF